MVTIMRWSYGNEAHLSYVWAQLDLVTIILIMKWLPEEAGHVCAVQTGKMSHL